jgi:eight-cysteine-cluster-containing protein
MFVFRSNTLPLAFLFLSIACGKTASIEETPTAEAPVVTPMKRPDPAPNPSDAVPETAPGSQDSPKGPDPKVMYADCRERVEMPESSGECKSDADCAPVGCAGEVCTSKVAGQGLATTCEMRPCFQALDTCGCREGLCSWSLKAEVPAMPPTAKPVQLRPR